MNLLPPVCTAAHLDRDTPTGSICIPLLAQGEALGVLSLYSRPGGKGPVSAKGGLSPKSRDRLAAALAEQVGMALANLRLRETLRLQAIRDPLTGLFNRRYMEEALDRDLRRACRNHSSLGIILMDLDHFKSFNDSFGHSCGDAVLREISALLHKWIRIEDIACRYGGEEFAIVLPETPLEITSQRAEMLRQEVNRLKVEHLGRSLGNVSLSIGIAVCPDHGHTVEGILRSADLALYSAKVQGRNRVVVAGQEHPAVPDVMKLVPSEMNRAGRRGERRSGNF